MNTKRTATDVLEVDIDETTPTIPTYTLAPVAVDATNRTRRQASTFTDPDREDAPFILTPKPVTTTIDVGEAICTGIIMGMTVDETDAETGFGVGLKDCFAAIDTVVDDAMTTLFLNAGVNATMDSDWTFTGNIFDALVAVALIDFTLITTRKFCPISHIAIALLDADINAPGRYRFLSAILLPDAQRITGTGLNICLPLYVEPDTDVAISLISVLNLALPDDADENVDDGFVNGVTAE